MMIWNSLIFNFPSNMNMEMIHMLMDYTVMMMTAILFSVTTSMMFILTNNGISTNFLSSHELELIWSIIPFLILIMLSIPTLKALYMLESCEFCGMGIKITGYQWYWSYNMELGGEGFFSSYMTPENYNLRLLDSDNSLVVPLSTPLRIMVTSNDVIHSWTIPSAGIKTDAIPGRVNQSCFTMEKLGKFYGQCSEICGANHSFMPISLESMEIKEFIKMTNK